jgi:hypothetical protein
MWYNVVVQKGYMHNEVLQAMRCEEALDYWQQALLGRPVDKDKLEEAFAHIGTCRELCARILSSAPDFELFPEPMKRSGRTDYYEARGLAAEEEGDAHAHEWKRLQRLATTGKATREAVEYEYAMAVAAWQAAINYYQDGLKIGETAFLADGLKRLQRKRLEPIRSPQRRAKADHPARRPHKTAAQTPREVVPGASPPHQQPNVQHVLSLVSHVAPRAITVGQQPPGWQRIALRPPAPLYVRETSSPYSSSAQDNPEPGEIAAGEVSQIGGMLDLFDLALAVTASADKWALDLLVRATSPRRPWSSILLTLEGQQSHKPVLMEFSRQDPQRIGWHARLKEIASGQYQLRLFANDARGHPAKDAALALRLTTDE